MDYFLKVEPDGYVALAKDGNSGYRADLIVKVDHEPSEGDVAAVIAVRFGKKLP